MSNYQEPNRSMHSGQRTSESSQALRNTEVNELRSMPFHVLRIIWLFLGRWSHLLGTVATAPSSRYIFIVFLTYEWRLTLKHLRKHRRWVSRESITKGRMICFTPFLALYCQQLAIKKIAWPYFCLLCSLTGNHELLAKCFKFSF